ncbi:hypothetical protein GCM10010207_82900 [Streptomyces atratus]|uniref:nuclear transport factor 2 family protein n=1 Tax=Streptomyces atratus TaxID=1893 RepID=UPI0019AB1EC0|nr:nuclear transport factor 2 family protein [Streptomyces atratus]GGT72317.1 hypothetical protein GCM10010207_82900 [Streptomyces atratus]
MELVHRLDLGEPSTVCDLFTPDGVWEWPYDQQRIEGREALREHFGSRPVDQLSRRMCTNTLATVDSPDIASAITYFATYRVDGYDSARDLRSGRAGLAGRLVGDQRTES